MLARGGISITCIELGCDKQVCRASSVSTKDVDKSRLADRHAQLGCSDTHREGDIGSDDSQ